MLTLYNNVVYSYIWIIRQSKGHWGIGATDEMPELMLLLCLLFICLNMLLYGY